MEKYDIPKEVEEFVSKYAPLGNKFAFKADLNLLIAKAEREQIAKHIT